MEIVSQWVSLHPSMLKNMAFPVHINLRCFSEKKTSYLDYFSKFNIDLSELALHWFWFITIFKHYLAEAKACCHAFSRLIESKPIWSKFYKAPQTKRCR